MYNIMLARLVPCLIVVWTTIRILTACSHGDLRLVNGSTTTTYIEGRVELCANGEWRRACSSYWYYSEGAVACRQLGCAGVSHTYREGTGTEDSVYIYYCYSTQQQRLLDCYLSLNYNCTGQEEIGVRCQTRVASNVSLDLQASTEDINSTSILLTWESPTDNSSLSPPDYKVTCDPAGAHNYTPSNTLQRVTDLQPYTTYNCCVSAVTGCEMSTDCVNITTSEAAPSCPPTILRSNPNSPISLSLTWTAPLESCRNGIISSYRLHVCNSSGVRPCVVYTTVSDTTATTVTGLQPYYYYDVSVAAYTVAQGPYSTTLRRLTTQQNTPSCPPTNLQSNPNSPTILSLTWTAPSTTCCNGIITSYRLHVCNSNGARPCVVYTTVSNTTVTGLQPYYYYDVSVAAYTVAEGPNSTTLRRLTTQQNTPDGPPQDLISTVSSTVLSLSWNPPPLENRRGVITRYDVIITNTNTSERVTRTNTGTDQTFITVSDLHPHYNYTISVAAYTVGAGPNATDMVRMLEDVPSASPTILSLTTSDSRTLQVSWLPPPLDQQNGVIRRYQVRVCGQRGGECTSHNATGLTLIVTDLHPYYWYNVSVAAVTVGLGPYTTETIPLPEDVPDRAPQDLINNTISSTSVHLSWSPPPEEYQNGVIRGYNVSVTNDNNRELERKLSTDRTFITVFNLHPHYNYTISVTAYNSMGASPYATHMVTMPEDAPSSPPQSLASEHVKRTSVILSWEPPSPPDQNGVIRYYTITLYNTTHTLTYTTNETSLTLIQLTLKTTYYWSVRAHTISPGPPSNDTTLYIPLPKRSKALEIGLYSTAGILFPVIVIISVLAVCFVYRTIPSKLAQLKRNSNGDKEKTDTEGNDNQAQNTYTNRLPWQRIHFKRSKKQSKKTAHTTSKGEDSHTTTESHYDVPVPTLPERRYLEDIDFVAGEFDMILKTQPKLPERDYLEDIDFMVDEILYPNKEEDNTPTEESQAIEMKPLTTNTSNNDKVYENLSGVKETSHQPMSVNEDETTGESHYQPLLITHQQTQQSSDYASLQIRSKPTRIGSTTDNNNSTGHYQPLMLKTQQTESQYAEVRGGLRLAVEKTNTAPQTRSGRKRDAKNIPILPKPSAKKTQVRFNDTLQN